MQVTLRQFAESILDRFRHQGLDNDQFNRRKLFMRTRFARRLAWLGILAGAISASGESRWPQFRGPNGLGVASEGKPPVQFGPNSNVVWKTALPPGASSPCIWNDRIFLTAFDKTKLETLCIDRRDGKVLWRQSAPAEKIEPTHRIGSPASATPATDGERVYVYFGSFGLLAYDFTGQEQWRKPLAAPMVEFGAGTSPVLAGDLLVLNCDQDLGSYLLAVNRRTGKTVWKTDRSEFRRGFATPFVWRHDGIEEVVVPGSLWLKGYDLKDGKERWMVRGMARVACASPVAGDGLLFISSWNVGGDEGERITMPPFKEFAAENDRNKDGRLTLAEFPQGPFRDRFTQIDLDKDGIVTPEEWQGMVEMFDRAENALLAIRPGGHGDITRTHVVWKQPRHLPYVSSPLYYAGRVYAIKNGGLASCYDAKSGKAIYQAERMGALGDYYSSAVAANGMIYIASQKGTVVVLQASDAFDVAARNEMGEEIFATPAVVDGKLYLRTAGHLYAFGE